MVGEIAFAGRFGFLNKGEDLNKLMAGIEKYLSYGAHVGMISELHYPLMRFMEIVSRGKPGGPLLPVFEVFHFFSLLKLQFVAAQLEERKEFNTDRRGFFSRFLKQHSENPEAFTMQEVLLEVGTVVYVVTIRRDLTPQWRRPRHHRHLTSCNVVLSFEESLNNAQSAERDRRYGRERPDLGSSYLPAILQNAISSSCYERGYEVLA